MRLLFLAVLMAGACGRVTMPERSDADVDSAIIDARWVDGSNEDAVQLVDCDLAIAYVSHWHARVSEQTKNTMFTRYRFAVIMNGAEQSYDMSDLIIQDLQVTAGLDHTELYPTEGLDVLMPGAAMGGVDDETAEQLIMPLVEQPWENEPLGTSILSFRSPTIPSDLTSAHVEANLVLGNLSAPIAIDLSISYDGSYIDVSAIDAARACFQ